MALVTIKSGVITSRDAVPKLLSGAAAGTQQEMMVGTLEATAADSSLSKYIFGSIPSNALVSNVLLWSDDLGTTGTVDFGIYETVANGGLAVDADFFQAAVNVNSAALNASNITHGNAAGFGLEDAEKPLWQALGLTTDPGKNYDVVGTVAQPVDTGGTLTLKVQYGF